MINIVGKYPRIFVNIYIYIRECFTQIHDNFSSYRDTMWLSKNIQLNYGFGKGISCTYTIISNQASSIENDVSESRLYLLYVYLPYTVADLELLLIKGTKSPNN